MIMFASLVCFSVYLIKLKSKDNTQVKVQTEMMKKDEQVIYYEHYGTIDKEKVVTKNKWADLPDGISDVQSVTENDRSAFNKTKGSDHYLGNKSTDGQNKVPGVKSGGLDPN